MWQSSFSSLVDVILWDAVSGWWQCAQWQWWRHPRPLRFTNTAASYPDPTPHTLAQLEVIYESDWEENETQLLSPPRNFPAEVKIRSCHFIPKEDFCLKTPVGYFKQQVNLRRTVPVRSRDDKTESGIFHFPPPPQCQSHPTTSTGANLPGVSKFQLSCSSIRWQMNVLVQKYEQSFEWRTRLVQNFVLWTLGFTMDKLRLCWSDDLVGGDPWTPS